MNFVRKIFRTGVTPKEAIAKLIKHLNKLIALCEEPDRASSKFGSSRAKPDQQREENAKQREIVRDKVATDLAQIRFMLLGDPETPPVPESCQHLVEALLLKPDEAENTPLCVKILNHAQLYPRDAQKEAATIVNYVIRNHKTEFVQTFDGNLQGFVKLLLSTYKKNDPRLQIQMTSILREMIKYEDLHRYLLTGCVELRPLLFANTENTNFDVSSDAVSTLSSLLTTNKGAVVARFLAENYAEFFTEFHTLIKSENYATKRQSLCLLWKVLLDKTNRPTMMRYISDKYNLQLLMKTLHDPSNEVPFEAFQMFKVFVANRSPTPEIYRTLWNNKEKLIDFLEHFQNSVAQDDQFTSEKLKLVTILKKMDRTPAEYEEHWNKKAKKAQGKTEKESEAFNVSEM